MKNTNQRPIDDGIPFQIDPTELRAKIQRGDDLQIIDVREFPEFASGHISNSQLIPLSKLGSRYQELNPNLLVVCVCRSGKRSGQAAKTLRNLGLEKVLQLQGGLLAWERSGLPLVRNEKAPWSIERQVRFGLGLCVLAGLLLSLRWPAAIIICWMMGTGMVLTAMIDWCGMALILAKAPWNREQTSSCSK